MKVIVCGGRDFNNIAFIWRSLDLLHEERPISALMQGGAQGVDSIARDWARTKRGIERYVCKADWDVHRKAAGPIRNARMLEWGPDLVVAFPGGVGTANMVEQARRAGVEILALA